MGIPFVNIHTHRRTGEGIEVVSVVAQPGENPIAGLKVGAGTGAGVGVGVCPDVDAEIGASARSSISRRIWPEVPFSFGIHPWQLGENAHEPSLGDRPKPSPGNESESSPCKEPKPSHRKGPNPLFPVGLQGEDLSAALCEIEIVPASAVGEIGLDFAPAVTADHGLQKMVFAAQLRIAEERRLPVVLHCVKAFESVMEILATFRLPAVIFHGFTGSREQSAKAVRAGYYISLGERSFDSLKTLEAVHEISLSQLFLETDRSPLPIAEIYARAAKIFDRPVPEIAEQIHHNYIKVFGL